MKVKLPLSVKSHPVFNTSVVKLHLKDHMHKGRERPNPPIVDADRHERYIVEKVLKGKIFSNNKTFLVKWKGYSKPKWKMEEHTLDELGSPILPLKAFLERLQGSMFKYIEFFG